jgi:hypothetical protein
MSDQEVVSLLATANKRRDEISSIGRCRVNVIMRSMSDTHRKELEHLLADRSYSGRTISHVLTQAGYEISRSTIHIHRAGECACLTTTA